ncbi:MAG: hypothetical protein ABJN34_10300 [Litoreibacter sp.]|uniref:hypothetical protein n=1 Tax=Litoreibacter sp. TaxID=1969459 RepID=UPI003296EF3A
MRWLLRFFGKYSAPRQRVEKLPSPAAGSSQSVLNNYANPNSAKANIVWRDGSFPLEVVGESNYQRELVSICGRYTRLGYDAEHSALMKLEPSNPHDSNAVVVKIKGQTVGYLPRQQAVRVGTQMKEVRLTEVNCNARVRGGWRTNQHDEGSYGVRLAVPTRGLIDFGLPDRSPMTPVIEWPKKQKKIRVVRPKPAVEGLLKGQRIFLFGCAQDGTIAQELAAHGATLMSKVGKTTSMLVIARERPLTVGISNSAEYKAAEEFRSSGNDLEIVTVDELRKTLTIQ